MRKLVEFDANTFAALRLLAADRMSSLQELADEAFADLLRKHGRPTDVRDALKMSLAAGGKPVAKRRAPPHKSKTGGRKRA
jgi:hypothetical protein